MKIDRVTAQAVAASGVAMAVGVAAVRGLGGRGPALLVFMLGLVLAACAVAASHWLKAQDGRPASWMLFLFPVALALGPAVEHLWAPAWPLVALGLAVGLGWLAARQTRGLGVPLLSLPAGVLAGTALRWLRLDRTSDLSGAKLTLILLALAGLVWLVGWVSPRAKVVSRLGARPAWGLAVVGHVLALALSFAPRSAIEVRSRPSVLNPVRRPPIVLIVLDTVRADHLKSYGYGRATMPGLEQFAAAEAIRIERAVASAPLSLESHASMFTGLDPPRHGAHLAGMEESSPPKAGSHPLPQGTRTLAGELRAAGYWTVGLSANFGPLAPFFGLDQGFDEYQAEPDPNHRRRRRFLALSPLWPLVAVARPLGLETNTLRRRVQGPQYFDAAAISRAAAEVVARAGEAPFFLFLNYFDAHLPYPPAEDEVKRLLGRDLSRSTFRGDAWTRSLKPFLSGEHVLSAEERQDLTALYDVQLMRLDAGLRPFLGHLRQHPRWREMIVVITSDHGESLGEHDLVGHGSDLVDSQLRVPLWVKPGVLTTDLPAVGGVIHRPFVLTDLMPTLLSLAGLASPEGLDGVPWAQGRTELRSWLYYARHLVRFSPRFDRELRSVERDGYKLIASNRGERRLFHLPTDSEEGRNLATFEPELLVELEALLLAEPSQPAPQTLPFTADGAPDHLNNSGSPP